MSGRNPNQFPGNGGNGYLTPEQRLAAGFAEGLTSEYSIVDESIQQLDHRQQVTKSFLRCFDNPPHEAGLTPIGLQLLARNKNYLSMDKCRAVTRQQAPVEPIATIPVAPLTEKDIHTPDTEEIQNDLLQRPTQNPFADKPWLLRQYKWLTLEQRLEITRGKASLADFPDPNIAPNRDNAAQPPKPEEADRPLSILGGMTIDEFVDSIRKQVTGEFNAGTEPIYTPPSKQTEHLPKEPDIIEPENAQAMKFWVADEARLPHEINPDTFIKAADSTASALEQPEKSHTPTEQPKAIAPKSRQDFLDTLKSLPDETQKGLALLAMMGTLAVSMGATSKLLPDVSPLKGTAPPSYLVDKSKLQAKAEFEAIINPNILSTHAKTPSAKYNLDPNATIPKNAKADLITYGMDYAKNEVAKGIHKARKQGGKVKLPKDADSVKTLRHLDELTLYGSLHLIDRTTTPSDIDQLSENAAKVMLAGRYLQAVPEVVGMNPPENKFQLRVAKIVRDTVLTKTNKAYSPTEKEVLSNMLAKVVDSATAQSPNREAVLKLFNAKAEEIANPPTPEAHQSRTAHQEKFLMPENGPDDVVYNFFIKKGLTPAAAAGAVGSFSVESASFTFIDRWGGGDLEGDGQPDYYGLGQWDKHIRFPALVRYAEKHGLDHKTMGTQLKFVWHELNTTHKTALWYMTHREGSAGDMSYIWGRYFEGAMNPNGTLQAEAARIERATAYYDKVLNTFKEAREAAKPSVEYNQNVAKKIVTVADGEYGKHGNKVVETCGQNCGSVVEKYTNGASGPDAPWCGWFVSWVYRQAGLEFRGKPADANGDIPAVSDLVLWFKKHGTLFPASSPVYKPHPGDVVMYGGNEHTGIVVKVDGHVIETIEGNTSSNNNYKANGGTVGHKRFNYKTEAPANLEFGRLKDRWK